MAISLKTHKILWGRAGNVCSFSDCKKELVIDETEADDPSIVGEEAHIVAEKPDGPRGDSNLLEQRDKYDNLILLCRIHHKQVDDQPCTYTVEKLKEMKKAHENWVKTSLKIDLVKQRDDELYASYIDEFNALADMEHWEAWTSWILGSQQIQIEQYDRLRELVRFITSRVWPKRYSDLENAFYNFRNVLNELLKVFDKYSEKRIGVEELRTERFYKIKEYNPELYNELLYKYNYHVLLVEDLTLEMTRAVNYIFDLVRGNIFSSYRIKEGVLLMEVDSFIYRVEYRKSERVELPYPGLKEFMDIRKSRDTHFGEGISNDYFSPVT
ncbi:MAG: hypothetical protein HZA78_08910 [Candidatus Schekmanbacteria bacterium]|nr:hypothetical protein [Candidatus Schekmanbacteria bacterium]